MAFVQTDVNYATQYSADLANAYPYLSHFGAIYGGSNSSKYRPIMGKSVAIPSMTVSGAVAADRDQITGTFNRNWNNAWQTVSCQQDREWSTLIDPLDIVETSDVATIANVTKSFNEQQKVPEMDAFCAATLSTAAITANNKDTTELTSANILGKWDDYLAIMTNARVNRDRLIAYMTPAAYKLLKEAAGITRFVDVATGIRNVDRNVGRLDGVTIVEVPADLMRTAYDFDEGWAVASGAGQINMMFVDPEAVAAPIVYDTAMIGAPTAQSKGKYLYYERYYYGVFVLANRTSGIYVNYTANP